LVQAGADSLVTIFDQDDVIGVFQFAMTGVSIITRFLNGTILVNVKHMTRFYITATLQVLALLLVAVSALQGEKAEECPNGDQECKDQYAPFFWVSVSATVFVGISSSLGEATFLGYCNGFPNHVVGFVSSGTGCAGITGTLLLLILQTIGLANSTIFFIAAPTLIFYFGSSIWLNYMKTSYKFLEHEKFDSNGNLVEPELE